MKFSEENVYSAFGLEKPESGDQSSQEDQDNQGTQTAGQESQAGQDRAQEVQDGQDGTQEEQSSQDSLDDQSGQEDQSEAGEEASAGSARQSKREQTVEERRENAARRRRTEQQAAIQAAVTKAVAQRDEQHQQELEDLFKSAGLTNPFTKEPIHSLEDFRKWRNEQEQRQLDSELQSGRLSRESLERLIAQSPAVRAAGELAEAQRQAQAQAEAERFQRETERQLAEIRKADPSIQTVGDLLHRPYSKDFYSAVKRGNNFLDAFYLATRESAMQQAAAQAKQQAINQVQGKDHLRKTGGQSLGGASISPEELQMYRLFNPQATAEEIQKFQNKEKKGRT